MSIRKGIVLDLRYGIQIPGFRKFVQRLFFHALRLHIRQFLVDVREPLRGDVGFIIERPNLILALVGNTRIFGLLHLDLQLFELVGQPGGSLGGGFEAAAIILFHESFQVGVDDLGRQHRIRGLKADVQKPATGHATNAQAAQKFRELRRALLVRQTPDGYRFRRSGRAGKFRARAQPRIANRLQRQSLAGEHLGLRLDIIVEIHGGVVRVVALEGQNVGTVAVDFDTRGSHVYGLHLKSGYGDDGNHGQHERQDEPLVFAENQQIIVKVRLARRELPIGQSVDLHGAARTVGGMVARNYFMIVHGL